MIARAPLVRVFALALLGIAELTAGPRPPNIVFILADDLGARDLGCYGSTYYETPNIDRLSARGMKFTQAYAASPLCSPTRSSILCGQYPARIGITAPVCHLPEIQLEKKLESGSPKARVLVANSLTRLKPDYVTLAEALRTSGYATAHFGKWHLGHNLARNPGDHFEPRDQGFDSDFPHTPNAPGPGGGYLAPWKFIKDPTITDDVGMNIEDRMSKEAAKYVAEHKDRPFYLNYWAFSVHSPWNARPDYVEHFKAKADPANPQHNPVYAAMVKSLDDGVGRLLQAIDDAGVADNTIVVFFSDNGGYAYPPKATTPRGYEDIPATSNLPFRSGKASLYEGGTREPFLLIWPGQTKAGTTSDLLFQSTDFYPTLLSMCGLRPPAGSVLDGHDQSQAFVGGAAPRDRLFCHFPHGNENTAAAMPGFYPGTYVRKGNWKLIRFYARNPDGSDQLELYDLREDVGETRNRAAEQPALVAELNALITEFLRETAAVVPKLNPGFDASPKAVAKTPKAAADPLLTWKNRNCAAQVKDGVLTATGNGPAPFLGVGPALKGAAQLVFRMRSTQGGSGHIDLLPPGAGKTAEITTVPYESKGGDWQEVTVNLPEKGPVGILRLYLPSAQTPVEIDWIELRPAGTAARRWDF